MLPLDWYCLLENTTTSRRCFVSCTGCVYQSASASGSRLWRSDVNTTWHRNTLQNKFIEWLTLTLGDDSDQPRRLLSLFHGPHIEQSVTAPLASLQRAPGTVYRLQYNQQSH
jgi:hypothetical protein